MLASCDAICSLMLFIEVVVEKSIERNTLGLHPLCHLLTP